MSISDKELADKVVALGVGEYVCDVHDTRIYSLYDDNGRGDCTGAFIEYEQDEFVRNWRVAGALMEKLVERGQYVDIFNCWKHLAHSAKKSLPRAIIEACVEALGG